MTKAAVQNLEQYEQEYYTEARDNAGPDWCQADRDDVSDRCNAIRHAAFKAHDTVQDYSDAIEDGLYPALVVDVAEQFLGDYESTKEPAILGAAVRVVIEGGKV